MITAADAVSDPFANIGRMSDKILAWQKTCSCSVITAQAFEVTPMDLSQLSSRARRSERAFFLGGGKPSALDTRRELATASPHSAADRPIRVFAEYRLNAVRRTASISDRE